MSKVVTAIGIVGVSALAMLAASPAMAATSMSNGSNASSNNSQQLDSLKARVARMEAQLAKMSQNSNRNKMAAASDWFKKVSISGGLNVDAKVGSLGNKNGSHNISRFSGQNGKFMSLNDAYLNVGAQVNNWVSALVGVTYSSASENYELGNSFSGSNKRVFDVDQAYVTLSNFQKWPYYIRVGRQYLPFGQYSLHPITKTMTQVLSESDVVALNGGFVGVNGFNASGFIFQNPVSQSKTSGSTTAKGRKAVNWGFSVGWSKPSKRMGYYVKGSYLYNMTALDVFQRTGVSDLVSGTNPLYKDRVGAWALNAGMNSGPFDVSFNYVSAVGSFDKSYYSYKTNKGAHPTAWNLQGGYDFKFYNRQNRVALGWGHSTEASFLGLPQNRYYADYTVGVLKNVSLTAEYSRDVDYGKSYNAPSTTAGSYTTATGNSYNVITLRLGVNF